jgi:DNA-directed RNA polymerase subunit RPC12/RpoP
MIKVKCAKCGTEFYPISTSLAPCPNCEDFTIFIRRSFEDWGNTIDLSPQGVIPPDADATVSDEDYPLGLPL